jgi:hypothetical protein
MLLRMRGRKPALKGQDSSLEVTYMKQLMLFGVFLMCSAAACSQEAIPSGTVLPVRLNSSLSLTTEPGKVITARVMQNVVLPDGGTIRAGARVVGHVIAVTPAEDGAKAQISFTFDKVVNSKRTTPITTDLRAAASFMEVEDAQIPKIADDRGTPESAFTTVLVGGDDVAYRGGGPVKEGSKTVGRPVFDGVLSQVSAKPGTECRGEVDGNNEPQALWVFSSDACALYGFPGITIAHAGRTNPIGEIVLTSNGHRLNIPAGTGMLLRVMRRSESTS